MVHIAPLLEYTLRNLMSFPFIPFQPLFPKHPGWGGTNGPCAALPTHYPLLTTHSQSPFNALFRHSMHGNTVQRNVWCPEAKFGRLDTYSWHVEVDTTNPQLALYLLGGTIRRDLTEGEECRMS